MQSLVLPMQAETAPGRPADTGTVPRLRRKHAGLWVRVPVLAFCLEGVPGPIH